MICYVVVQKIYLFFRNFCLFFMISSCAHVELNLSKKESIDEECNKWQLTTIRCIDSLLMLSDNKFDEKKLNIVRNTVMTRCSTKNDGLDVRRSFLNYIHSERLVNLFTEEYLIFETEHSGEVHFWSYYLFKVSEDSVTCIKLYKTYDPWETISIKKLSKGNFDDVLSQINKSHSCESTDLYPAIMSHFLQRRVDVSLFKTCIHSRDIINSIF